MLFELKRKWKLQLVVFFFYQLANVLLVMKLRTIMPFGGGMGNDLIAFVYLLGMTLPVLSFVDTVNSMRLEVKNPTRDLYFALPNNGFEKVGSKIVIGLVSMSLAGLSFVFTTLASTQYLTGDYVLYDFLKALGDHMNELTFMITMALVSYALLIAMIYLAFALFRSFFSQWKFGGLITFGLFIAINYVLQKVVEPFARFNIDVEFIGQTVNLWAIGANVLLLTTVVFTVVYALASVLFEYRANFD